MSDPLKSRNEANYASARDSEYGDIVYEEEWLFSQRTKRVIIAISVIASIFFVYLFCVLLPKMFIPELRPLEGIVMVQDLPVSLDPVDPQTAAEWNLGDWKVADNGDEESDDEEEPEATTSRKKIGKLRERLILVGDIHGQLKEFKKLLGKVKYNQEKDHLLVLGDFITKGRDSIGVLELLDEYNADCILGNHEYYVLNNYARFHGLDSPFFVAENSTVPFRSLLVSPSGFIEDPEYLLAKKLQPEHIAYINKCLLIKKLGPVPLHSSRNNGKRKHADGLAVHAGLRLDALDNLNEQEPMDCLEMRSYLAPHFNETTDDPHEKNAVSWSKVWNAKQKEGSLDHEYIVYYGHDARRGVKLKKWAKGLDSGCVRGDQLSAMVIWQEKTPKGHVLYKEQVVSVDC